MKTLSLLFCLFVCAPVLAEPTVTVYTAVGGKGIPVPHTFAAFNDGKSEVCISWVPAPGQTHGWLKQVPGKNLTLKETLEREAKFGCKIVNHGTKAISKDTFDRAVAYAKRLDSGAVGYKFVPFGFCENRNCYLAVEEVFGIHVRPLVGRAAGRLIISKAK